MIGGTRTQARFEFSRKSWGKLLKLCVQFLQTCKHPNSDEIVDGDDVDCGRFLPQFGGDEIDEVVFRIASVHRGTKIVDIFFKS